MTFETHGLDTQEQVFFYEQEFYVLSNFSAFNIEWKGIVFDTSERVYHWEKFNWYESGNPNCSGDSGGPAGAARDSILRARSAHDAFKVAQKYKEFQNPKWNQIRNGIMIDILEAKVAQHPYVKKKLLETGNRELIENSWRDDYWGWGPNKDGANQLGHSWMYVRGQIRAREALNENET